MGIGMWIRMSMVEVEGHLGRSAVEGDWETIEEKRYTKISMSRFRHLWNHVIQATSEHRDQNKYASSTIVRRASGPHTFRQTLT